MTRHPESLIPPPADHSSPAVPRLTPDEVRRVAVLARLAIPDDQAESYRAKLSAVIEHADRLRTLDVSGVEPLSTPTDAVASLRDDVPASTIATEALMRMAPEKDPPFIRVPKVTGAAGGA